MKQKLIILFIYIAVASIGAVASLGTNIDEYTEGTVMLRAEDFSPALNSRVLAQNQIGV